MQTNVFEVDSGIRRVAFYCQQTAWNIWLVCEVCKQGYVIESFSSMENCGSVAVMI